MTKNNATNNRLVFLLLIVLSIAKASATASSPFLFLSRGGASTKKKVSFAATTETDDDAYEQLARALQSNLPGEADTPAVEKALKSLSSAQKALKGLDGAAHEAYQRTHSSSKNSGGGGEKDLTSVRGRARRSASRAASTADAFLTAELCDLIDHSDDLEEFMNENGTLANRTVILKDVQVRLAKGLNLSLMVLWEPSYQGGAGLDHGGIRDLVEPTSRRSSNKKKPRGRLLIVVKDPVNDDLKGTFGVLNSEPLQLELKSGLVANEIASVHSHLYRAAGRVIRALEPTFSSEQFRNQTTIAVHFVGRSLAGGVASLAAVILDGSLPLPEERRGGRKSKKESDDDVVIAPIAVKIDDEETNSTAANETLILGPIELDGFGRGRSSAMVLGAPPCLSANVKAAFVKSIIYGDDVVCRTTQESIERLCERTERALKGGAIGRKVGWMSDVVSLTVTSMKSHARGSEGEEGRLVAPGQAFLIRPRRLGGACSMHEVGGSKGGREALRAAVLWQLNDVLLSKSLWKHHQLESYIQGLDKVQLRGVEEDE